MAHRTKLTQRTRERFLRLIEDTGNVSQAAVAIRVTRRSLYDVRKRDAVFAAQWDDAIALATQFIFEPELIRRAVEGWEDPVYQGGECVGMVRKYSDSLLVRLLQAHDARYRDKVDHKHTGKVAVDLESRLQTALSQLEKVRNGQEAAP